MCILEVLFRAWLVFLRNPGFNFAYFRDLNIDTSKNTDNTKTLLDLLCIYNLKIKIDKPTRVTKHSETIIDHVITNIPTCYCDTQVINSTLADHFAIMIDINIKTSDSVQKIWEMRRQNYPHNINLLKKMLEAENWETIYAAKDANTKWNQFYSLFNYYYDVTCPVSKRLVKQKQKKKSWVTGEVIHARNNLRVYYDLSKQKNNEAYNTLYKIKKKEYCSFIRETKASFIRMSIDKGKNYSKGLWSFINGERGKVTNRAEDICPLMSGKSNANPLEVANTFNRYYITVADELISQNKTNAVSKLLNPPHTNHTMVFIPTTDAEVSNLIKQLKIKHSSGLDGVTSHLIKECRECILKPLTHMLNAAIEEGIFPDSLKVSKVKPIFKKGNRDELGNYRPISLISTFAKIYEMIIKNRIVSFITKYSILHSSQHGFREGKSTKTASTDIIEHILNLLDRQQKTCEKLQITFTCVGNLDTVFAVRTVFIHKDNAAINFIQPVPVLLKDSTFMCNKSSSFLLQGDRFKILVMIVNCCMVDSQLSVTAKIQCIKVITEIKCRLHSVCSPTKMTQNL
ncbi:uncharacterized protein LOC124775455 [Schistocerca piceifrons]|uniref:uncharacterized protein LOC124775455 n=1 Tax=Schistocerca piceifrons TaxID=274613 RepID=UPI001F5F64B2|nr:uncharacterized protein LOC124775455 [Schistocerca piceifrons]